MKTYQLTDSITFNDIHNAMAADLDELLLATKVISTDFGVGDIRAVYASKSNLGNSFGVAIRFGEHTRQFHLGLALKNKVLELSGTALEIFNQYISVLNRLQDEQIERDRLLQEKRQAEELAAKKAAEEQLRIEQEKETERRKQIQAQIRLEARKKAVLAQLERLTDNKMSVDRDFYEALGWLAQNLTSISATMPDFCEPWFRARFGDVKARVVDQSKKSPGGWVSQWGLSLVIHLKQSAKNDIPEILRQYTERNQAGEIADTRFVYTLLEDYGFKIGSAQEQNIAEIKRYIPTAAITDFDIGYAA